MAKKPASVPVSRWQKTKPTKHIGKRRKLKSALLTIFNYMKSDSYMFAPLIYPQSSPCVSSEGEGSFELVKKKEKKLVHDVDDYLKCDTYMYAPLIEDSIFDGTAAPSSGGESGGNAGDEMESRGEQTTISSRDNPTRRIVFEQIVLKNIVHQNCGSLSASGKVLSQKKPDKVLVE